MRAPVDDIDLFSDEFVADPWPHLARLREVGPVVWLSAHGNYALTRHEEVRAGLRDVATFISGDGVAADEFGCTHMRGNTVASDGARHRALREAMTVPLLPGALGQVRERLNEMAVDLVEDLVGRDEFDTVTDLARYLPFKVVAEQIGLPDYGQERQLRWAGAAFEALGVQNERGRAALPVIQEMRRFISADATADTLTPGSWTHRILDMVAAGDLDPELAPFAIRDYINPSLDTTISAINELIVNLSDCPDQWDLLRAQPALANQASNEAIRMASPIRSFSRHAATSTVVAGVDIPAGSRVMMLYASANRDPRVFPEPDRFDITRNPKLHVAFGSGPHMCGGMHLAQMELEAIIGAMIPRVASVRVRARRRVLSNTLNSWAALPTAFTRAEVLIETAPPASAGPRRSRIIDARVAERLPLARGIVGLVIESDGDEPLPAADPGAHIDVYIRPGLVRQYSLTGPPRAGRYLIAVQREADSRGGSVAMHERFPQGSPIRISVPRNNFRLREHSDPVVLLAGGVGLTPLLSMAWGLHARNVPFQLHVSVATRGRLAFADELRTAPFADQVVLHVDDEPRTPGLDAALEKTMARHAYVCGPRGYLDHVTARLVEVGLAPSDIHVEHFAAEIDVVGDPFTVVADRSGRSVQVAADERIIDALSRIGIDVETSCANGVCGTCLTRVLSGMPDHRDLVQTDEEKSENVAIAVCCSRSRSPALTLDL